MIIRINSIIIADMEYKRILNLKKLLAQKSFFLFGPRSTGKTYLIDQQLKEDALIINLLKTDFYLRFSSRPSELEELISADPEGHSIVVIDEVQKIPDLLSEVHNIIGTKPHLRFLLTGSSARKLRKKTADMLAGRAWTARLFPLSWSEIPDFDLERYLRYGGLPQVYPSQNPEEELYAYVDTYLKEEIRAEGLLRSLPPFSRFLKTAALSNGSILNFTEVANDSQVPPSTVREYYSILEDTLIGFMLEPWRESKKRKAIQTAKFYFFDTGVTHTIAGTKAVDRNSNLYGNSFEQFIIMELRAYLSYRRIKEPLRYWRSSHGHEVDAIIGDHAAIEIKSASRLSPADFKGLKAISEEGVFKNYYLISQDKISAKKENILALHWKDFLRQLWRDEANLT